MKINKFWCPVFLAVALVFPARVFAQEAPVPEPPPAAAVEPAPAAAAAVEPAPAAAAAEPVPSAPPVSDPSPPAVVVSDPAGDAVQAPDSSAASVSPQTAQPSQQSNPSSQIETTINPHDTTVAQPPSGGNTGPIILTPPDPAGSAIPLAPVDPASASPDPNAATPAPDPATAPVTPVTATPAPATTINPPVTPPDPNALPAPAAQPLQPPVQQPIIQLSAPDPVDPVADFVAEEPDSEFSFAVKGAAIAAAKNPEWQKSGVERGKNAQQKSGVPAQAPVADVTAVPTLAPDMQDGLNISANCSDAYYVILLYSLAEDYDKNPASYIFNKAFDCIGGQFTYSLKDLPDGIKDGDYYLLIGAQGTRGSWRPDSALVPITIKRY